MWIGQNECFSTHVYDKVIHTGKNLSIDCIMGKISTNCWYKDADIRASLFYVVFLKFWLGDKIEGILWHVKSTQECWIIYYKELRPRWEGGIGRSKGEGIYVYI